MTSGRIPAMLLLTCFMMSGSGELQAQSTGSSGREKEVTAKLEGATPSTMESEELDTWLRRLVGQFRIVDTATEGDSPGGLAQYRGSGDCTRIGTGPGVHCIVNVVDRSGRSIRTYPKAILYGITPEALGITYMEVDSRSRAEGATGSLKDDMAYFHVRCPLIGGNGWDPIACRREVRISAPQSGKFVELWIRTYERVSWNSEEEAQHMEFLQLQRQPTEETESPVARPGQLAP